MEGRVHFLLLSSRPEGLNRLLGGLHHLSLRKQIQVTLSCVCFISCSLVFDLVCKSTRVENDHP